MIMANPEHLEMLSRGVDVLNAWLSENPERRALLGSANLSETNLQGVNLARADLEETNLARANLEGAILARADLHRADLTGANLYQANLHQADLSQAILIGATLTEANLMGTGFYWADLSRTNLTRTILTGANLTGANLTRAVLSKAKLEEVTLGATIIAETDFSEAHGLDRCRHGGPSTIDHRTLKKIVHLPEAFLRGCGLSNLEISAARLLYGQLSTDEIHELGYEIIRRRAGLTSAIEYHSCFISYSSKDEDFARRLHNDLQESGVRCWFAPEKMKIGDPFRDVIEDAVRVHDKLLLILSKHSVKSEWVKDEVEAALEKERRRKGKETILFPIKIDDAIQRTRRAWAAKLRRQRHIGDFRDWTDPVRYDEAFQRLLKDLRAET